MVSTKKFAVGKTQFTVKHEKGQYTVSIKGRKNWRKYKVAKTNQHLTVLRTALSAFGSTGAITKKIASWPAKQIKEIKAA